MANIVQSPFQFFTDNSGNSLEGGKIFVGTANLNPETSPIDVFYDLALTLRAPQPILTRGGKPWYNGAVANIFTAGGYSILVKDRNDVVVYSDLNVILGTPADILSKLLTVDGSGSGLIAEGLQTVQITDLNFDPTALGLAIREMRTYTTSSSPANRPTNTAVDFYTIVLTKIDASNYMVQAWGRSSSLSIVGGVYTRYYNAGWGAWKLYPDQYDHVVDSNAALDQWVAHAGGLYKRVLVRAGSWTATALGATAGVLLNLDTSGTTYVFAEPGSNILFSGSFAGSMYGLYHAATPTDLSLETFNNLKITLTNTNAGGSVFGFNSITNLYRCTSTATLSTSTSGQNGFLLCSNLANCNAVITGIAGGTPVGFNNCSNLTMCSATSTTGANVSGFINSTRLVNCTATASGATTNAVGFSASSQISASSGTATGTGAGNGKGFDTCNDISACTGSGSGGATGAGSGFISCTLLTSSLGTGVGGATSGAGKGFDTCTQVIGCRGVGTAAGAGTGHGFFGSVNLQQNRPNGASKTATYDATSFAGSAANAPADTAAGGYNLP